MGSSFALVFCRSSPFSVTVAVSVAFLRGEVPLRQGVGDGGGERREGWDRCFDIRRTKLLSEYCACCWADACDKQVLYGLASVSRVSAKDVVPLLSITLPAGWSSSAFLRFGSTYCGFFHDGAKAGDR